MKRIKRLSIFKMILFLLVTILLLSGCKNNNSDQNVEQADQKLKSEESNKTAIDSKLQLSVSDDFLNHHPENLRTVSSGDRIFAFGDRGIYLLDESGWNLKYEGAGICGMDVTPGALYFLKFSPEQNHTELYRLNTDTYTTEMLQTDSLFTSWLRIYDNVLYYYSDDMLIHGIELNADGSLGQLKDITSADYHYRARNKAVEGLTAYTEEVLDPAYSMQYYKGLFEFGSNNEIYKQLYLNADSKHQLLVPALSGSPLIAGNLIYYKMAQADDDDGIYCYNMNTGDLVTYETGPATNIQFINYDERYIYYTEGSSPLVSSERTIMQLDTQTGITQSLFSIVIGEVDYTNCFDVCGDWILYRDVNNDNLVLRNKNSLVNIISEP